jgi:MFS transporter, DHA1 family, inner membrane transport protein
VFQKIDGMLSNTASFSPSRKLLLLGILSAVFAVNIIDVFVPLVLPEIAKTYGITLARAATLTAFSSLAGVATGFALSIASIRVRYKTLLVLGAATTPICVLGVYLAPSFLLAQAFYALNGVGSVIVAAMVPSLIAELYPLSKKAKRISLSASTAFIAIIIASPITGFLSSSGAVSSWRNSLLWFLLPATTICLLLAVLFIPSKTSLHQTTVKAPFMNGFKEILGSISARACLANSLLGSIWLASSVFGSAFYASVFSLSPASRGMINILGIGILVAGVLIGGFLVNSVGRKRLMVTSAFAAVLTGVLSYVLMVFVPNLWLGIGVRTIAAFFGGFVFAAGPNLLVEQVPNYRGTMMSLAQGLNGIGVAIGVFVGGAALTLLGTSAQGYSIAIGLLGLLALTGTSTLVLFAKDPCKL